MYCMFLCQLSNTHVCIFFPLPGICLLSAGGGFSTNPPVIAMGMRQYYGLFRIDNQYFCSDGTIASRNVCNMPCQQKKKNFSLSTFSMPCIILWTTIIPLWVATEPRTCQSEGWQFESLQRGELPLLGPCSC
uniref:Uncharacterized protein n=1 Tax=Podarcis muralis TaxID=64176 RepID=A0A670K8T1_PODMU